MSSFKSYTGNKKSILSDKVNPQTSSRYPSWNFTSSPVVSVVSNGITNWRALSYFPTQIHSSLLVRHPCTPCLLPEPRGLSLRPPGSPLFPAPAPTRAPALRRVRVSLLPTRGCCVMAQRKSRAHGGGAAIKREALLSPSSPHHFGLPLQALPYPELSRTPRSPRIWGALR